MDKAAGMDPRELFLVALSLGLDIESIPELISAWRSAKGAHAAGENPIHGAVRGAGSVFAGRTGGQAAGDLFGMPLGAILGGLGGHIGVGGVGGTAAGAGLGGLLGKLLGGSVGRTLGGTMGYHNATEKYSNDNSPDGLSGGHMYKRSQGLPPGAGAPPGAGMPPGAGGPPGGEAPSGPGPEELMALLSEALQSGDPKVQQLLQALMGALKSSAGAGPEEPQAGPGGGMLAGGGTGGPPPGTKEGTFSYLSPLAQGFIGAMVKQSFFDAGGGYGEQQSGGQGGYGQGEAPMSAEPNPYGWNRGDVPQQSLAEAMEAAKGQAFLPRQYGGSVDMSRLEGSDIAHAPSASGDIRPLMSLLQALRSAQ